MLDREIVGGHDYVVEPVDALGLEHGDRVLERLVDVAAKPVSGDARRELGEPHGRGVGGRDEGRGPPVVRPGDRVAVVHLEIDGSPNDAIGAEVAVLDDDLALRVYVLGDVEHRVGEEGLDRHGRRAALGYQIVLAAGLGLIHIAARIEGHAHVAYRGILAVDHLDRPEGVVVVVRVERGEDGVELDVLHREARLDSAEGGEVVAEIDPGLEGREDRSLSAEQGRVAAGRGYRPGRDEAILDVEPAAGGEGGAASGRREKLGEAAHAFEAEVQFVGGRQGEAQAEIALGRLQGSATRGVGDGGILAAYEGREPRRDREIEDRAAAHTEGGIQRRALVAVQGEVELGIGAYEQLAHALSRRREAGHDGNEGEGCLPQPDRDPHFCSTSLVPPLESTGTDTACRGLSPLTVDER